MFEDIRRQQELQKANILRGFGINPENEDLELEIFKAQETDIEKAKHQDGDMHPNGKWVWVSSANGGKGDWRTIGGRAHKKSGAAGGAPKQLTANGGSITKVINKITSASKNTKNPEDMSLDELNAELTEINNNISNTKKLINKLEKEGKDGQASHRKLYVKTKYEERKYIQEYIDKLKSSDSDTSVKYSSMDVKDARKALKGKIAEAAGSSSTGTSGTTTAPKQSKTPKAKPTKFVDTSKIISKIPNQEFKSITHILEKIDPDNAHAENYLEDMTDKELNNFWACADHFKTDYQHINQSTRERCAKWKELANSEMSSRKKTKTSNTTAAKTPISGKITDNINIDNGDGFSYIGISSKGIFKLLFPDLNDFTYEEMENAGYDTKQMSALAKDVKEVSKRVQDVMMTYQSVTDKLNPPESHSYGKLLYQHFNNTTFTAATQKTSDIEKKAKEVESKLKKAEALYDNTPKFGRPGYNRKYLEGKAYAVAKLRAEQLAYDTILEARKVAKKELGQINLSDYKVK